MAFPGGVSVSWGGGVRQDSRIMDSYNILESREATLAFLPL